MTRALPVGAWLAAWLAAGPALAQDAPEDEEPAADVADAKSENPEYGWGGIGLPLVNYNSTDGLGFGAGAEVYTRKKGDDFGYRDKLSLSTFWTTSGNYSSNYAQYERRDERYFLVARATYRIWKRMIYVGQGGSDVAVVYPDERRYGPDGEDGNRVEGPSALVTAIFEIPRTPVYVWGQVYLRYTGVSAARGTILADDRPWGVNDGFYADVSAGVFVQETDRWPMPNRGVRFETSVRAGGSWSENRFEPLVGVHNELIGWVPVAGQWFVIGGRTLIDKTFGERPFYEQEWNGGILRDENAYEQMLTGYARSRTRGDGVVAAMIELRPKFGQTRHPVVDMAFYASVFAEAAWLFEKNDAGPFMPSVGVAPELLWQGAVQLRPFISWGWLSDTPGGTRTPRPQVGISLLGPL